MLTNLRVYVFLLCILPLAAAAQKKTVEFARYNDSTILKMDIYTPSVKSGAPRTCILFIFGGAFAYGSRDYEGYLPYFKFLSDKGYVVASIDYRLGMKGAKKLPSLFNRKPLIHSIEMAVEDAYAATNYLVKHAGELDLDTGKVIISGASSGGITALQADYERRNGMERSHVLPGDFEYAGVISFAGAIYSKKGRPAYKIPPAPILLFHGDADKIVPYNKISLFGTGLFGSRSIASGLSKDRHPYCFYTMVGIGHDVALYPMLDYQPSIDNFIREYIIDKRPIYVEVRIRDDRRVNNTLSLKDAYK